MNHSIRLGGWQTVVWIGVTAIATVSIFQIASIVRADNEPSQQQDVLRLESRLTQLEQRIFTMENSIRTVEQQSRMAGVSARGISQDELNLLRSQFQTLEQRLREDECGIARLDERTLSPQRREARRRTAAADPDQCRQNVDTPLRLP